MKGKFALVLLVLFLVTQFGCSSDKESKESSGKKTSEPSLQHSPHKAGLEKILSYEPNGTTPEDKLRSAHKIAVDYRKCTTSTKNTYCPYNSVISVNASTLGFTEYSQLLIEELQRIMVEINTILSLAKSGDKAERFRIIPGITDPDNPENSACLIVVPLKDGTEWPSVKVGNNEINLIRILDYKPDCPIICDFTNSKILLYPDGSPENSCK